ncbi:MAG TPA: c-type cytochrome [Gaiellaceae bacterium]|nr:c-type cytochrome [Gaiellaceae bacterium]
MRRFGRVTIGGAGLVAAALLASGCGTGGVASASGKAPDTANGQTLFTTDCGTCHTLAAAGTSGTIGPDLDNAFAGDVAQGYKQSSIENLVLDQIRYGSGEIATYTTNKKFTVQTPMPANIVTGQDAVDVAAYVASVAGANGYTTSSVSLSSLGTNGKKIVQTACASCHTLADAGIKGTVGPNLDQLMPSMALVVHQVTNGGSGMPAFQGRLTAAQIQAVARYVSSIAGKK